MEGLGPTGKGVGLGPADQRGQGGGLGPTGKGGEVGGTGREREREKG